MQGPNTLCFVFICEFDVGTHSWLFGERGMALGRVTVQAMEAKMVAPTTTQLLKKHRLRQILCRNSRGPWIQRMFLSATSTLHRKLAMMMVIRTQALLNRCRGVLRQKVSELRGVPPTKRKYEPGFGRRQNEPEHRPELCSLR